MSNIFRHQFRAKIEHASLVVFLDLIGAKRIEIERELENRKVLICKLFRFEDQLFVYLESENHLAQFDLPAGINQLLLDWPGQVGNRKFLRMLDIFHDAVPRSETVWREAEPNRKSVGSIVYLRPEKYCSYVFYHFQLQEEGLRKFNKYYLIGAHENCLFSYQEIPAVVDITNHDRVLNTNNSPENWTELMGEHFQAWPEGLGIEKTWKAMEELFTYSKVS